MVAFWLGTFPIPGRVRAIAEAAPQGTTEGSLFVAPDYLKLTVLQ